MQFCIVGTGRCGSTLLRNLLNQHPEVFVFNETHWIPKMYEIFGTGPGDPDALISIVQRTRHVTGKPVTEFDAARLKAALGEARDVTVREFCDRLGTMFALDDGKRLWADKTPDYGPHMAMIQGLWPECRFVHVVRDPAEVVSSMAEHPGYRWLAAAEETWWCPASFNNYHTAVRVVQRPLEDFVALWQTRLVRIHDEAERLRPGTLIEVRFADLIGAPKETLRRTAAFLELRPDEAWVDAAVQQVQPERPRSQPRPGVRELVRQQVRHLPGEF